MSGMMVELAREIFLRNPRKSIRRARLETRIFPARVYHVTRNLLQMTAYELQLVQAYQTHGKQKCLNSVLICKRNLKKTSLKNILSLVMRPHFIRIAMATSIIFAFGTKKIPYATVEHMGSFILKT